MAEPVTAAATPQVPPKVPSLSRPIRLLREAIALILWLAVFAHLFVLDIGSYLASHAPALVWIFRYRTLVLLGTGATFWLALGTGGFARFFGYVIAYPFVLVFWRIPRLLFRNWAVLIAFSPAIHSIFRTFKSSFVLSSAALISCFAIGLGSGRLIVIPCMVFLGLYLAIHYLRRFRAAFSPSTVFADVGGKIREVWRAVHESDIAKPPTGLDRASADYQQKFGNNLLNMYMITTGLYLFAERLRAVVRSRILDLYFLAALLYTFFLTAVIFGVEYLGLDRAASKSFAGSADRGFPQFLGLSFSRLMNSDISPLKPVSGVAQTISYLELFCSLLIIVLLGFIILTSIRERYRKDLDDVVSELATAADEVGRLVEANYDLTITAMELFLLTFNPLITKWILKLRYGPVRAAEIAGEVASKAPDKPR